MKPALGVGLACVVTALLGMQTGAADVVTLANGSRLVGTVERMTDDKLIMETGFAGRLELALDQVESVSTGRPVKLELNSGDRLVGEMEHTPADGKTTVKTAMGPIEIDFVNVTHLWAVGAKSPEAISYEQEVATIKEQMEAQRPHWTATLEAGANYSEGNKDILEARGRLELKRTTADDILLFYLSGVYGEQDKRRSTAEAKGGASYEYSLTDRFFWQARSDFEYDEFEKLDLRAMLSTGPGYYWIKEPDHELKTRAGVGYLHESFMDGTTVDEAMLNLGLNYRVDLFEWLQFQNTSDYYPTFEGLDDYRLSFDNALIIPLADSDVWKLKLGALYEYDSKPRPGVERLDQTYYANLLLEIK